MTTPRLRNELQAAPADEQGIKYFDVSDPKSGAQMRMYDFEWLLASQMDGKRELGEIARWAKDALRIDVSAENLDAFVRSLGELGFFMPPEASSSLQTVVDVPNLPRPEPELEGDDVALEMDDQTTTEQAALIPPGGFIDDAETTVRASLPSLIEATRDRDEPTAARPIAPPPPKVIAPPPAVERTIATVEPLESAPPKRSSGSMVFLLIVLLAVGGVVVWVKFFAPGGAKVSITVAKPGEVVRLYDGGSKLDAAPPKSLSFGEAGKVIDVVAAGTEVKTGMPLATIDAFTKVEKELADVKDRLSFYQKQADAAAAKNDEKGKTAADGKVAEKQKLLTELETRAGKLRLTAPGPGIVDKVLVTAGNEAKADEPAIQLNDKRLMAVFKLPADAAAAIKAGDDVSLQRATGGAVIAGKAAKIEDGSLTVEIADGTATTGTDVRLVKSRLPGVVTLPAGAVVQKSGGDVVYTLADGTLHEKHVVIADRSPSEVYVSSGVTAGESVVANGATTLSDGQKASVEQ